MFGVVQYQLFKLNYCRMLLIHISDLHFRKGVTGTAMDPYAHIRNELLRDAEAMCVKLGSSPDAILVSGDLTYAGDSEEFGFALEWLGQLCEKCGAELKNIFVIPGNHDVVRKVAADVVTQSLHHEIKSAGEMTLDSTIQGFLTNKGAGHLLYSSLGNYNNFAGQFFCGLLPPERTIAKRDLLLNDGSKLRLSGLNSTFVSSEADKAGELFVDPSARNITRGKGVENIVLCHHPYSWLRHGDTLSDHLNGVARIHLFGHEHTSRIVLARDYVCINASAAHPERTEHGWEPGYNLIELSVAGKDANRELDIHVHVRVWQQRPNQFRPKMDKEEEVFHHKIELDAWVLPVAATESKIPLEPLADKTEQTGILEPKPADSMDTLRDLSIRFFKLTLSQKSAIAGKLALLEDEDMEKPDFERFRQVLIRARDRGQIDDLEREVKDVENNIS